MTTIADATGYTDQDNGQEVEEGHLLLNAFFQLFSTNMVEYSQMDKPKKTRACSICGAIIEVGLHHGSKCNTCYNKIAREKKQEFRRLNPEKAKEIQKKHRERCREQRLFVLTHYCGGAKPFCVCCGEAEFKFLCIDHIHGGGNKHRVKIFGTTRSGNLAIWLFANGLPDGFQVLCHNCNMAKGAYGECPHRRKEK